MVGAWKIAKPIGSGGQGSVYEVRRVRGRAPPRALKACFLEGSNERARFIREIELLGECASEHVLALIETETTWAEHVEDLPPFAYYVSERCDGSLLDVCNAEQSPWEKLKLFRQACNAVAYLHGRENPVLHRDIKPANFLVAPEPRRLVIADFGIAREVENETTLTEIHEVVGSRFFRAPETLSGGTATVRSDVYSLGRLLEWMMSGILPQDVVPTKLAKGHRLSNDACDRLDAVIARAAAVDPRQRHVSAEEMLASLPDLWLELKPQPTIQMASTEATDADRVTEMSLDLVGAGDTVGWRRLQRDVRANWSKNALEWRADADRRRHGLRDSELGELLFSLVDKALPRIGLTMAGIFGGRADLAEPRRLVTDIVLPDDSWNIGGLAALVNAPWFVLYVSQHLVGAVCVEVGALEAMLDMVSAPVRDFRYAEFKPLWRHSAATYGPEFFGGSVKAWEHLEGLHESQPVLHKFFATAADYKKALGGFNRALTLVEFAASIDKVEGQKDDVDLIFGVPPMYGRMEGGVRRAITHHGRNSEEIARAVAARGGVELSRLERSWPKWKQATERAAARGLQLWASPEPYDLGSLFPGAGG